MADANFSFFWYFSSWFMNTQPHSITPRPAATEAEIEALFGKPNESTKIRRSFVLSAEQSKQLRECTTTEEALMLMKGWGYDLFDA